jgi:predicted O-methyltransferase YrrM
LIILGSVLSEWRLVAIGFVAWAFTCLVLGAGLHRNLSSLRAAIDDARQELTGLVVERREDQGKSRRDLSRLLRCFDSLQSDQNRLYNESKQAFQELMSFRTSLNKQLADQKSMIASETGALKQQLLASNMLVETCVDIASQSRALIESGASRMQVHIDTNNRALNSQTEAIAAIRTDSEAELRALALHLTSLESTLKSRDETELRLINEHLTETRKRLSTLRDDTNRITPSLERAIQRNKTETTQEIEALMQLQRLLNPRDALPLLGGWAMEPVAMLAIVELVLGRKPKTIVECGSGTSTIWLAYALERLGSGRVIALEHLEGFADKTRKHLAQHSLERYSEVYVAPLIEREIHGENYLWYATDQVGELPAEIDILIVDGPPGTTGPHARYPALPVLANRLVDGAVVVLDDAARSEESEIQQRWRAEFRGLGEPWPLGPRTLGFEVQSPG